MNIYQKFKTGFLHLFPRLYGLAEKYKDKIKFVISGVTATAADFVLLIILHGFMEINVVVSSVIAFAAAFFVSFYLQKFWTFRNNDKKAIGRQMLMYLAVALTGLSITAGGMFFLVIKLGVWYILAQAMVGVSLAIGNFLVYKMFIFKKKREEGADASDSGPAVDLSI